MRLGTTEIILIVVLALVLFGGGKLAGVGKALGKSIKDFKNEVKDDKAEEKSKEEKKDWLAVLAQRLEARSLQ